MDLFEARVRHRVREQGLCPLDQAHVLLARSELNLESLRTGQGFRAPRWRGFVWAIVAVCPRWRGFVWAIVAVCPRWRGFVWAIAVVCPRWRGFVLVTSWCD